MGDFKTFVDIFQASPALVTLLMIWWFARGKMREYDTHLKECNEIPKSVIVEKLDDFCERMDGLHAAVGEVRKDQSTLATQVNILVGRQMERDRA